MCVERDSNMIFKRVKVNPRLIYVTLNESNLSHDAKITPEMELYTTFTVYTVFTVQTAFHFLDSSMYF